MSKGFNLQSQACSSLKATHALAIYSNIDSMLYNALHFLKKGIENNEVVVLLSDNFSKQVLYENNDMSTQNAGTVVLSGVMGTYFLGSQEKFNDQKVLWSWMEMVREAEHLGIGLRVFVDLHGMFHHDIFEDLINCKSEVNSALQGCHNSNLVLKIINGCLEKDVIRLAPESFRLLQQHHSCVYLIPN
jgi:MEDS: MEthanogen/methylotroph, DcmR Sensory domain